MQGTLFAAPADTTKTISRTPGNLNHHGHMLWNFDAETTADALNASGLDWEVVKRPLFYYDDTGNGRYQRVERMAVVQVGGDRNNMTHGIVSDRYTPIQNSDIAPVIDPLLKEGHFRITQGGFTGANRCWMMATSNRKDDITGKGDFVEHNLMFHWKHDGASSVRAEFVGQRIACSNAVQTLFDQSKRLRTGTALNVIHHQNYQHTMNLIGDILAAQIEHTDNMVEALKAMAATKMLHPNKFFDSLIPMPDAEKLTDRGYQAAINRRKKTLEEMARRYETGLGRELRDNGTAWAAYCAATEAVDHFLIKKTRTDSTEYKWFKGGSEIRIVAFSEAMKFVEAA